LQQLLKDSILMLYKPRLVVAVMKEQECFGAGSEFLLYHPPWRILLP
jgi:hypothetical protein